MPRTQAAAQYATLAEAGAPPYRSMQGIVNPSILEALDAMKYEYMTPVQSKVLTLIPTGRNDW
jgi:superfamily II DNA/RNA helicase